MDFLGILGWVISSVLGLFKIKEHLKKTKNIQVDAEKDMREFRIIITNLGSHDQNVSNVKLFTQGIKRDGKILKSSIEGIPYHSFSGKLEAGKSIIHKISYNNIFFDTDRIKHVVVLTSDKKEWKSRKYPLS